MHERLILGMATMVESRDNSTGGHIRRTSDVIKNTLFKWLGEFKRDETKDHFYYESEGKIYLVTIRYLYDGKHRRGYQFFITDDTDSRKYVKLLANYNDQLSEEVAEKTQTSSPKKSVPVEGIFLTVFGGVFFLFGMFFIFILHSVLPSDESAMLLVYLGPGIFVVVGLVILSVGIYSLATRRPVGKLYINGVPVGENEEDDQDPGRDRES